ncbi:MAG: CbtB-domain containing protein [Rhodobacterales bacterium]|nr:CbtB-domain containing protein [Rhodobacterales bacterium]
MTTMTKTATLEATKSDANILAFGAAALTGVFLIFFAGFAQATVFHDTAHDARHAIAFPCH